MHSHAGAWERENHPPPLLVPMLPCGDKKHGQRNVCIPTQERGNERFVSPCSHAPVWKQETVSVMYAFPRRSVGTRDLFLLVPMLPCGDKKHGQRNVCIPTQERGNEKITLPLSLFPCSRVGTRNTVSVMYAFPRRSVGTRKSPSPSPCSHAPVWEQETVSVMYAFPRRSVGTRDLFLLVPMLPRGNKKHGQRNVCIPTQERGNEKITLPLSLFPCSRVGTRNTVSVMYAFPRRSVGAWERENWW